MASYGTRYVIEFRFPSGNRLYAGLYKGAYGWAPALDTALVYDDPEKARKIAKNAYGASAEYAHVMIWHPNGSLQEVEEETEPEVEPQRQRRARRTPRKR